MLCFSEMMSDEPAFDSAAVRPTAPQVQSPLGRSRPDAMRRCCG
jgi:hypothetical protein